MKKILAVALILIASGWAFYLYGRAGSSEAVRLDAGTVYQPDQRLPHLVEELDTLKTSLRRNLELLDHAQKKRNAAGTPKPDLSPSPLRDPFAGHP